MYLEILKDRKSYMPEPATVHNELKLRFIQLYIALIAKTIAGEIIDALLGVNYIPPSLHCTANKIRFMSSHKLKCAGSFSISTLMSRVNSKIFTQ